MSALTKKLYCYVDESGQDTGGKIFLVAVVLKDSGRVSELRQSVECIEVKSGKYQRKWTKTPNSIKQKYLDLLLKNKRLEETVFYSAYPDSKQYTPLLALTIVKSINFQKTINYSATIIIDGLKGLETEYIRRQLKNLNIHYSKIRGMKDEQDALLRLADSMAGFVRDYKEGQKYAQVMFLKFAKTKIIKEI